MARHKKKRCCRTFGPSDNVLFNSNGFSFCRLENIELGIDEFEAMRLCDYEGLDQSSAGDKMGISRATVQRLLYSARKKFVESVLNSKGLVIVNNNK